MDKRPPLSAFLQKQKEEASDDAVIAKLRGAKGDPGKNAIPPSSEELKALILPLIPAPIPGINGDTPTEKQLISLIKPLILAPIPGIKGDDGITPPLDELEAIVLSLIPDVKEPPELTPKDLIEKINKAKTTKISRTRVEGMDELEGLAKSANKNVQNILSLGGSRQTAVKVGGVLLSTGATTINFVGATGTSVGDGSEVNVTTSGSGSGTVTSTSVVSANGFAGSVATATTTPAITLSTTTGAGSVVYSDGTAINGDTSNFFWDSTNKRLGIGTGTPAQTVDIVGTGMRLSNSVTDATNKAFKFFTRNFTNAQNDFLLFFGQSKTSSNTLLIGGGQTGNVAATIISFFTGAGNNTDTGTSRVSIDNNGLTVVNLTGNTIVKSSAAGLLSNATAGTDYQAPITLTTTGTSGAATFSANTLNIPQYTSGGGSGTVTSVASADASITVTNPTTTVDLAVVSAPKLTTARTIDGQSFDGSANITVIAPATHAATSKATPVDADELPLTDSAASFVLKKLTWANVKATLKTYFDTLYPSGSGTSTGTNTGDQTITLTGAVTGSGTGSFATTIATPGTLTVASTNSTATAHTHAITSSSAPGAAASLLATDSSGIIGSTGTRIVKGWFTDLTVTNNIAGSITGNAATVTTNANLTGPITSSGNATTVTNSINLPASPTTTTQAPADNSTKIATTAYVDAAVLGQNFKEAVRVATTGNLVGVYLNGASGVGATFTYTATGTDNIDGVNLVLNDRVLVKNQTTDFQNGIYTVTTAGSLGVAGILTRATDANQSNEYKTGDSVFVTSGTTLTSTTWAYTGIDSPTMGTTSLTYAQTAGQGTVTAGNGITVTGLSVAIDTTVTVDKTTAQVLTNKDLSSATNTFPAFIKRSVNSISSPQTAGSTAATDYIYLVSGTTTLTMPTAAGNTNLYTIKNVGTATITIATTSAQTIDGSTTATIPVQYTSLDLVSNGSNWNVI